MPYFGLRLTLGEIFGIPEEAIQDSHKHTLMHLIRYLISEYVCKEDDYILAAERLNKFGEATKYHYHFNFISDMKKESLRKQIVRKSDELGFKLKGNKTYCLQCFPEPNDYHRWFRYCLKEKYIKKFTKYTPDENAPTLKELEMLAKDERKQTINANIAVRKKSLDKKTYFDKIVKHLEKKDLKTKKDIFISITKYYVDDGKPVNPMTIKGYTHNYMIMKKLMSYDTFYQLYNKDE